MARTKLTPHKSTGPKGAPRRQLASRNEGAGSSRSRPDLQAEVERLSVELAQLPETGLVMLSRLESYRVSYDGSPGLI
jgi:hypothetical protein